MCFDDPRPEMGDGNREWAAEKGNITIMAQNDIGIDLGTTTIIIAQEGQGVVLNQPSVVAVDTRKNCVLEAGDKALAMVGRTPNYISAIFPLKDGVISDHTMTRELICRFVNQVYSSHMVKPRVAVCVPAAITGIESDAVVEAVMAAGARQVYLIDEPIAAALGSGIDITVPDGRMIIDIGGGTTDIAVLSLGGKVKATSVRVAGNHYDEEILKFVRNKFSIAIGQRTAENLKKNVACCPQKADFNETMEIKGRSLLTGLPVRVNVSTADLYEPVMRLSEQIGTAAHQVLENADKAKYNLIPVYIDPKGQWYPGEKLLDVSFFKHFKPEEVTPVYMEANGTGGALYPVKLKAGLLGARKREPLVTIDVALPAMHGMNGEDGTLQGLLELAGDIYRNGVVLTGGGAQLHGLPEYLSQELKVEVTVSPDPVNCVALGTAMSLRLGDKLETGFMDATPRMGRR